MKRGTAVVALVIAYVLIVGCAMAALLVALYVNSYNRFVDNLMYSGPGGIIVGAALIGLSIVFGAAILGVVFRRESD